MSLEAWGDENPDDAYVDSWMDAATDAGWVDPADFSPGAVAILNERERQETKEGWTLDHDDLHVDGQMAGAAAAYALYRSQVQHETIIGHGMIALLWPWDAEWWKPKDPRADLVRAGALIAAEIDRLDRLEKPTT